MDGRVGPCFSEGTAGETPLCGRSEGGWEGHNVQGGLEHVYMKLGAFPAPACPIPIPLDRLSPSLTPRLPLSLPFPLLRPCS